jgi:hypothetical protein
MLPGIHESIKALSNASLYYLVCDIHKKRKTGKWPTNSQMEYYIDEFRLKFGLSEPEIESMAIDAVNKVSTTRFKTLFEGMAEITYEMAPGAHTRHQCSCGRNSSRRERCVQCILESISK